MVNIESKGKSGVAWITVVKPTKNDVDALKKIHKFHPVILDELLGPSERSRVELYASYMFLTYHLPIYEEELKTSRRGEIDFLITKDKVITVYHENLAPIENLKRALVKNTDFRDHVLRGTAHLVYHIIEEILSHSNRQIRHIEQNVKFISQEIFKGRERDMLERISYVKRDILDYSIVSEPQEILLTSLAEMGEKFWGGQVKVYLMDLVGDHHKILRRLKNYIETIESLETTNAQLLSAKMNIIMQRFTILAFLTFPLVLFLSLVETVDFVGEFVLASPVRFWSIFGLVAILVFTTVVVFRKKRIF